MRIAALLSREIGVGGEKLSLRQQSKLVVARSKLQALVDLIAQVGLFVLEVLQAHQPRVHHSLGLVHRLRACLEAHVWLS